jgi:V/A-type H+/Na+-transporting ATPase subunit E
MLPGGRERSGYHHFSIDTMNSELLHVIEAEAAAEAERALADARQQAGDIVRAAEADAQRAREDGQRARAEDERAVRLKAASAAELAASALRLEIKSSVLDSVFAAAGDRLQKLAGPEYRTALKALMAEAAAGFDGQFVVKVRGNDVKLAGEISKELKLNAAAEADAGVDGGAIVADRQGRMMVCNRFSDRIRRARPALLSALSQILWE